MVHVQHGEHGVTSDSVCFVSMPFVSSLERPFLRFGYTGGMKFCLVLLVTSQIVLFYPETTMVHDLGGPQVCTLWIAWFQAIPSCAIIISVEFGLENLRREIPTHTCAGSRLCIVPTRRRVKCVSPIL